MAQDSQGTSVAEARDTSTSGGSGSRTDGSASRADSPSTATPLSANVYETVGGEAYVAEIPVPGLTADEIIIEAEVDSLTVRTEPRQQAPETGRKYLHQEQSFEPRSRVIEFPTDIDTDNVRATLENGMLRVRVPKAVAGRRRVIRVG